MQGLKGMCQKMCTFGLWNSMTCYLQCSTKFFGFSSNFSLKRILILQSNLLLLHHDTALYSIGRFYIFSNKIKCEINICCLPSEFLIKTKHIMITVI